MASPYPLQGLVRSTAQPGSQGKSQVFENTVCAGQEACHNIHLNPSVGNQKMTFCGSGRIRDEFACITTFSHIPAGCAVWFDDMGR